MKKKTYTKDGMKQIVNSGWKLFDDQTNVITTGQVMANTQYSMCIRPWKETECNGWTNPEGYLMRFDMQPFTRHNIPRRIKELLEDAGREKGVILYMFFTINKWKRVEPFFWVVEDYDYNVVCSQLVVGYGQHYTKRLNAANKILKYITND